MDVVQSPGEIRYLGTSMLYSNFCREKKISLKLEHSNKD